MKIETYLNAMASACNRTAFCSLYRGPLDARTQKRNRQYLTFRARILRTVATYRNFAEANGFDEKQAWFWTDEWQAAEKEVDKGIT